MQRSTLMRAVLVGMLSTVAGAAWGHHSFAMFDSSKIVTISGTVKEFQWTNPHVLLWLIEDPKAADSDGVLWTIELSTSPGPLSRIGWTKRSLLPGDHVSVDINPLRSGEPGGSFKKLTISKTGAVLTTAPPDAPAALPAPAATP